MAIENEIVVASDSSVSAEDLYSFYEENFCCETRYSEAKATRVLKKSDVVVTARHSGKLVGIARAITDGLSAAIMEFSVALEYQGAGNTDRTGALIEDDQYGIGHRMGVLLLETLKAKGVDWAEMSAYGVPGSREEVEVPFYRKMGFAVHRAHTSMFWDSRPPWKHAGGRVERDFSPQKHS